MSFSTLILNLLSNVIFLGMILLTYKTEMLFSISHPPYCIVPCIARCWRPTCCFCHLFTIAWIFFDNQQQSLWLTVPKEKKYDSITLETLRRWRFHCWNWRRRLNARFAVSISHDYASQTLLGFFQAFCPFYSILSIEIFLCVFWHCLSDW